MSAKTVVAEFQAHSQVISELYLDGQSYDRQRLVNEARFCLAQSAESMLEAGKRLIVLKENERFGDFVTIVNQELGMDERIARKMMQAAAKYLSPKLEGKKQALAQLGKSKLYELMIEDDDELAALTEGGTVAGLELDDIDRMSCRELRQALRKAREDSEAKESVIADKSKKLDEMAAKSKKLKAVPPDEESRQMRVEGEDHCFQAEALIRSQLSESLAAIQRHGLNHGVDVSAWLSGQLDQIDSALLQLRESLGIPRDAEGAPWEEAVE